MFTGLVEETGSCLWLRRTTQSIQLCVSSERIPKSVRTGDSVAVNGCCLTVTSHRKDQLVFDLLEETLRRTNLGTLKPGDSVNLERALAADGRLGGHFVQGHVDDTIEVLAVAPTGPDLRLDFSLPASAASYVAYKGSVAINGVSLTVADVASDRFTVWIIPHTRSATNLGKLQPGDRVNLETDILAKYAERILNGRRENPR
jgi:riboflavin synthase